MKDFFLSLIKMFLVITPIHLGYTLDSEILKIIGIVFLSIIIVWSNDHV